MRASVAIAIAAGIGAVLYMGRANAAIPKAMRLVKETEGLSLEPYVDQGGTWHIGYGRALQSRPDGPITKQQAERMLREDLQKAANAVDRLTDVQLSANEKAALISFTYNLGAGALERSTLLQKINQGDKAGAAQEFSRWVYVNGQPSQGLRTRREAEKRIFSG